jgi:hypothetical protein
MSDFRVSMGLLVAGGALLACRETSGERASLIADTRILALVAEPAETAPGQSVQYRVLAVDEHGPRDPGAAQLAYCTTPKALGDNRSASEACAERAEGTSDIGTIPSDACSRFGPVVPAGVRPPDPDETGGYYQPVRVALGSSLAVGLQRVRCPLTNAPFDITRDFRARYVANTNPELTPLAIFHNALALDPDALPRDRDLTLRVGWTRASREDYVVYDPVAVQLAPHTESLRVSWFVTAGELMFDQTGRGESDPLLQTENTWHTPPDGGHVFLWVVLRDARGGTAFASYELDVP